MKTAAATLALAIMFLSAGALASNNKPAQIIAAQPVNITVIVKNQAWPVKRSSAINPCAKLRCFDI
ncbi:MAG: hypothetical protein FJX63_08115 [Alphaproteobacteria bacterium]|nr:hypothetical protein [Alphaproteobacteria bacterium]